MGNGEKMTGAGSVDRANSTQLSEEDSAFLMYFRGIAIAVIVFGHVGGFWFFRPYSQFLHVFVAAFFFISGAVSFHSYQRSPFLSAYYKKRVTGLLIPYYLLCLLCLVVYLIQNGKGPAFSASGLLSWISIKPESESLPFQVDHVWFLHALFIILVVSPLYFTLYTRNSSGLLALVVLLTLFSCLQLITDIHGYFNLAGHNLYKPAIHSMFFIFGAVYFSSEMLRNRIFLISLAITSIALSLILPSLFHFNIDYAFHTFSPDVYYLSGSFFAIALFLFLERRMVRIVNGTRMLAIALKFLHKHTFSIFLLHFLGIYIAETVFGLATRRSRDIQYGIIKLAVVFAITLAAAVPFSSLSAYLTRIVVNSSESSFLRRRAL